jgi:hypothetical protein
MSEGARACLVPGKKVTLPPVQQGREREARGGRERGDFVPLFSGQLMLGHFRRHFFSLARFCSLCYDLRPCLSPTSTLLSTRAVFCAPTISHLPRNVRLRVAISKRLREILSKKVEFSIGPFLLKAARARFF